MDFLFSKALYIYLFKTFLLTQYQGKLAQVELQIDPYVFSHSAFIRFFLIIYMKVEDYEYSKVLCIGLSWIFLCIQNCSKVAQNGWMDPSIF